MSDKSAVPLLPYGGTRERPQPATHLAGTGCLAAAQAAPGNGDSAATPLAPTPATQSGSGNTAVEISDLRVHYATQADPVLSVAHLRIARGEALALTGANGAGKSTLLKVLTGIVRADAGSVRIFGQRPERARGCIAYLPQLRAVDWQYPISVFDFALLGCSVRLGWLRRPGKQWHARTDELLCRLKLDALRSRPIRALSGGEQQRLLLARALLCNPDLFLLDEPLTAVDANSVGLIGSILEAEHRAGKTLIVATHHLDFGGFHFDRELQLHCGCVHAVRTGEDALRGGGQTIARRLTAPLSFRAKNTEAQPADAADGTGTTDARHDAHAKRATDSGAVPSATDGTTAPSATDDGKSGQNP